MIWDWLVSAVLWRMSDGPNRVGRRNQRLYEHFVSSAMQSPEYFASDRLPRGFGRGMSERSVEFPWVAFQRPTGRVLDAGSALNHRFVLDVLLKRLDELTIVTLAPEGLSFADLGVQYRYEDLRALSFPDDQFDVVVSVSTLEHVGLDNTRYGASAEGLPGGPEDAIAELRRVAAPGGMMLFTVPYGQPTDFGWVSQFDQAGVEGLVAAAGPATATVRIYRYGTKGWHVSSFEDAADAEFGPHSAQAVACVRLDLQ